MIFRWVGQVCTLMLHFGDPEEKAVLTLHLLLFCVILSTFFKTCSLFDQLVPLSGVSAERSDRKDKGHSS